MADILNRLVNAGAWGTGHENIDRIRNWVNSQLKKNGKRVTKTISQLTSEGIVGIKNNGRSIYLNPKKRHEIADFIDQYYINDWNKYQNKNRN
ncbi:MAG: hypothetical protein NWF07_04700 [Candidatus Bathyarchaeota archaeon]|nr:hypothetical protein [Candidatus Bathyarchaeota archaeon]